MSQVFTRMKSLEGVEGGAGSLLLFRSLPFDSSGLWPRQPYNSVLTDPETHDSQMQALPKSCDRAD